MSNFATEIKQPMYTGQKIKRRSQSDAFHGECLPAGAMRRRRARAIADERLFRLQLDFARLKEQVAMLECLVDPEEIAAAKRLRQRRVTNEQLRKWSQEQVIPSGLAEVEEERPW
jgi:hypothetical protein